MANSMVRINSLKLTDFLFPIISTERPPTIDPKNRDKSFGILFMRHNESKVNIASPAPTLSTTFFAKAGQ